MRNYIISIIITVLAILPLKAQKSDFLTWWHVELDGELFSIIDFEVIPEVRLNDNSTNIRSLQTDVDLSYPVTKFLRLGGQYRFQKKYYYYDEEYFVNRFGVYAKLDEKINRFRFYYRAIYQWEYMGIKSRELGSIPIQEHRHKIALSYYRKRWDLRPSVSYELFMISKPDFVLHEKKYRITAGLEYEINKTFSISLDYKYQYEFFETNPLRANIISTGFTINL